MKDNKSGFFDWLMFACVFFCLGWYAFIGWGIYNICKAIIKEKQDSIINYNKLPADIRPGIKQINTKEYYEKNLTKDEIDIIMSDPDHIRFVGRFKDGKAMYEHVNVDTNYKYKEK